jgi:exodeoxyribonuclease V beta subunit
VSAPRVARPAVLRGIPLDRHVVIEASAGTGKTFTLEHLVVELLLSTDVTLDRVLVVTFTEKATNELRTRLRAKLEQLLAGRGDPPSADAERGGDFWTLDAEAQQRLSRALHTFDGATIATIHAFCQRVLRENAFAGGRLFDEQHIDGRDAFGRALRDALRREVACDPPRARWLEAALGTGWTLGDIEDLVWKCVQARGALRPVFDPAALDAALEAFPVDDARRLAGPTEMQGWGMPANTAKAVGQKLYKIADAVERARELRSTPAFVLEARSLEFKYLLEKLPPSPPRPGPAANLCVAALKLARATPPFDAALVHALLGAVQRELTRRKREAGQYDFDDMLALLDATLRGPTGPALAEAMRERWRYALIDEFQDTDPLQWSIFRRAFFEGTRTANRLCLVGDPKQSIYRFRGADVHTYLGAKSQIVAAGGHLVSLDRNQRATAPLVDALNSIFDPQASEPVFTGDVRYVPVACGRPEAELRGGDGAPLSPVHAFRVHSGVGEAAPLPLLGALLAREIRVITDPARPWTLGGAPLAFSDVFVLTRNAREGRAIGAALREAGIPHAFYKEDGLFKTDEAREIYALLLAIEDPTDRSRRLSAWLTPFFGLPLGVLERARHVPGTHPLVARLHAWKALADACDFEGLFASIVRESGIVRREIFFAEGERELTNTLHILELLLEHARRTGASLRDLVHALAGLIEGTRLPLDLEGSVQRLESDRRAVQIMTIHKSKGLEAAVVFVAGGLSPPPADEVRTYHDADARLTWVGALDDADVEVRVKQEEREEDQRLMYVALTRAKGRLYLPCAVEDGTGKGKRARGEARPIRGPYDVVNRRIVELARESPAWLSVEDVAATPTARPASSPRGEDEDGWTPAWPAGDREDRARYAAVREQRAGAIVTSYTRMKGAASPSRFESTEDPRAEKALEVADEALGTTPLRSARGSGIFLHEALERVPIESFAGGIDLNAWRERADVKALFDEAMAAHRIDGAQRKHAESLVWAAYTTPVALPRGRRIAGLASAARVVREMEFVFPIPEGVHPTLAEPIAGPLPVERGYIRGSLDLAFEEDGITYFVDWKSDSLRSYAPDALARHVRDHYTEQAALYALCIVKLLGVHTAQDYERRFGGLLYCFLRGLDPGGDGVWSSYPSWDDVLASEGALRARRHWGGARSA